MTPRKDLLTLTPAGLYCERAGVFLDPIQPCDRALISHGHSDHARRGMRNYICTETTMPVLFHRLGSDISVTTVAYEETIAINGVHFSFHPAGHVPGSAQIRVEHRGEVWVYSGDYKTENDGVSTPFTPVQCHTFISECTFGLPIFHWAPQADVFNEIQTWWTRNNARGVHSVLSVYSLGKAQRVLEHLDRAIGPLFVHPTIQRTSEVLGFSHQSDPQVSESPLLIVKTPGEGLPFTPSKRFPAEHATASGWMSIRGFKRRSDLQRGFVLSDHADFNGLISSIRETKAERVLLTHGYTSQLARYLCEAGIHASELGSDEHPLENVPSNRGLSEARDE